MKKQIHPIAAVIIVVAVLAGIGYIVMQRTQYDAGQTPGIHYAKPKK